jgi:hypothetical protein
MANTLNGSRQIDFESLVESFDRVSRDAIPEVFVLEGPTGWGKTKIVQMFYEHLASSQGIHSYWPSQLLGEVDEGNWQSARKKIFPSDFQIPDDSLLPWLWWGISCNKRQDGRAAQVLFEDGTQLAAHAGSLLEVISLSKGVGRTFDGINAVAGILALTSISIAPPLLGVLGVTGFVRTAWQNRELIETVKQRRKKREEEFITLTSSREDEVQVFLTNLEIIASEIPVILVIDDAQWADVSMIKFLEGIYRIKQGKILAIVTSWPADEIVNTDFFDWMTNLSNNPRVIRRLLKRMTDEELIALAREEVSNISADNKIDLDSETAVALINKAGSTPLGVRAVFGLPKIREIVSSGRKLNAKDVVGIPSGLTLILAAYWETLPDDVRYILSFAAVYGRRFDAISLEEALTTAHSRYRRPISEVHIQCNFLRHLGDDIYEFVDHVWWDIARNSAEEVIANDELVVLYAAIARRARSLSPGTATNRQCVTAWAAHVYLAQEGLVPLNDAVVSVRRLAEDAYFNGDKNDSSELFLYALKSCAQNNERLALLGYYLFMFPEDKPFTEYLSVLHDFLDKSMTLMSSIGSERDASPELIQYVGQLLARQLKDARRPLGVSSSDIQVVIQVIEKILINQHDFDHGHVKLLISLASLVREVEGIASASSLIHSYSLERHPSSSSLLVTWLGGSAELHQLGESLEYFSSSIIENFTSMRFDGSLPLLDLLSRYWLDVPNEVRTWSRSFLTQQLQEFARPDYGSQFYDESLRDTAFDIPILIEIAGRIGIDEDLVKGMLKNVFSLLMSGDLFWVFPDGHWDGVIEAMGISPEGEVQSEEVLEIDESDKNSFLVDLARSCFVAGYKGAEMDIKRMCIHEKDSRDVSDNQWWYEARSLRLMLSLSTDFPDFKDESWCDQWKSLTEASLLPVSPRGLSVVDVKRIWLELELKEMEWIKGPIENPLSTEIDYFDSAYFALKHSTVSFRNYLFHCGIRWFDGSQRDSSTGY